MLSNYEREILEATLNNCNDGILMICIESMKFVLCNNAICKMLGRSQDELLKMNIEDIHPKESIDYVKQELTKIISGENVISKNIPLLSNDGNVSNTDVASHLIQLDNKHYIIGFFHDITHCERMKKDLQFNNLILKTINETSIDGILVVDFDGKILSWNQRFVDMYGISLFVMESRSDDLAIKFVLDQLIEPQKFLDKIKYLYANVQEKSLDEILLKDGRVFERFSSPMNADDGKNYGRVWYFRDITQKRKEEKEKMEIERKLLHTQRLESVGVFASGIAHDFNNLLTGILSNAEFIENETHHSEIIDCVHDIQEAAMSAAKLCRQLLDFSGKSTTNFKAININHVVEETKKISSFSGKMFVNYNLDKNIPLIDGDFSQIQQIIMNLIVNASDAMDSNGLISVSTGVVDCDEKFHLNYGQTAVPGEYVYLEVADTGCGMDSDTTSRMFDLFFTTKFTGRGLGMASVFGITKKHFGMIHVSSEVGRGTKIRVLFPISSQLPEESSKQTSSPVLLKGLVLVVDDEVTVLKSTSRMLEICGLTSIVATNGQDALDIFISQNIDCVLLDLTMPGMSADETLRKMKNIKPEIPVIICSGYAEETVHKKIEGMIDGFIHKPYRIQTLRDKLREFLEK